jgi:CubicO group peptidase (beta-lactamase class C family)
MNRTELDRRQVIVGFGATLLMSGINRGAAAGGEIDSLLAPLLRDGKVSGLHTLLAARGGRLVVERYWEGEDWDRGNPLGKVTFGPKVLHDLRSVSKSIVGMLYGIALADGKVPPPEARLYAQFPEYADLAKEPGRDRLTVAHVLSMTLGMAWDELTFPYSDPRNSEIQMDEASDRYRFILDRPIVGEPGVTWTYCGGATALLGRLIAKGTGQSLPDFARKAMFEPLGLGPTEWTKGRDGEPLAASGLRMRAPDLLRIGRMVLGNGAWQGRQIVPAEWLKRATEPVMVIDQFRRYGWHWYIVQFPDDPSRAEHAIAAIGWGGQRLFVLPADDLVVAMNAGNYGLTGAEQSQIAATVIIEAVLPSVRGDGGMVRG